MVEKICEICNYKTMENYNYERHLNSTKHKKNVYLSKYTKIELSRNIHELSRNIQANIELKDIRPKCDFCGMTFTYKSGLSKHKNKCVSKQLIITKLEAENKLKDKDLEMVHQENSLIKQRMLDMEKIILTLQETMHETINVRSKSNITTLASALFGPLKNNPPLKQIDHNEFETYIKPTSKLVREIMACFRDQTLHEFIGNFILYKVKKKNLHEQSIFASDTSRQSYYIKELILKNKSEWVLDKQGVRVKKILIAPITTRLFKLTESYFSKTPDNYQDMDIIEKEFFIKERSDVLKLSKEIDSDRLDEKINKFLCPHLQIDLNKFKTIKEEKRVPTLDFNKDIKDIKDIKEINYV